MSAPLPTNAQVADALERIGDLLDIEGAVRHRVLAYRRGAARIRAHPASVAEMALAGRATELPDIGATLQDKIVELARTGDIAALAKLRARVPEGLIDVARLEGLGPTRARALWTELGVTGLDDLRTALADGRVRRVRGVGPKLAVTLAEQLSATAARDGDGAPARVPLGPRPAPGRAARRRAGRRARARCASRWPAAPAAASRPSATSTWSPRPTTPRPWPMRWWAIR